MRIKKRNKDDLLTLSESEICTACWTYVKMQGYTPRNMMYLSVPKVSHKVDKLGRKRKMSIELKIEVDKIEE